MDWEQYVKIFQISAACISLLLNFILISLIIKKSPKKLGSYRYLMAYTALFEIFYSIVDVVVSPTIFSYGSMFLAIVPTKDSLFSEQIILLLICLWCGFFGGFMMLFCIQFIYRYFVVVGSRTINSFNDYRIVYWIMIPIISGTTWGTVTYLLMSPKVQIDNSLRDLLLKELDLVYEEITYIGPRCYYKTTNGEHVIDIEALIAIAFCLIVMTFSLSCILYFASETYLKIRHKLSNSTMSNKHNRLQSQTFYALVTQTLIPVILLHFPCSTVLTAAIFDIDLGHASGIVSITYAMFPALDPLPVMLIIQSYRGALMSVMSSPVKLFVGRQTKSN